MKILSFSLAMVSFLRGATTIDEIVAVVGRHAIKMSDIERDLRVTEFLNNERLDSSVAVRKKTLERLIDQELIRNDVALAGNASHLDKEAKATFDQLVRDRFAGAKPQMVTDLRRRGLTEAQLLEQLQWQLVVLRFIDQRFRPGVIVTDEEVRAYYEEHSIELSQAYPANHTLETLAPRIRQTLEGERINRNFEDWLAQERKNTRIEYKVEALK
jgi:peptidyl-prolyl cis-trans isomerase SurA